MTVRDMIESPQAEQFTVLGGSEETHEKISETLVKTFESLEKSNRTLGEVSSKELKHIILENLP